MKIALPEPAAGVAAGLGAALVAAGAWLLVPKEREGSTVSFPAVRVCLVDVSASAVARRSGWKGFAEGVLAEQREAARRVGEDLEIVLFGSEVRRFAGSLDAVRPERETRLAGALEVARGLVLDPARRGGRIAVVGDRTFTGEDPGRRLRELLDLGVAVDWIDLPPPDLAELSIGPLALPAELEAGAPIAVEADVFFALGGGIPERVSIAIERDSDRRTIEVQVPAGLDPDADGYLRWRLRCEAGAAAPGLNRIRVQASEGFVRCAGRLVIGVVAGKLEPEAGLDLEPLRPEDVGPRLSELDALVSGDLAPDVLPHPILESFVERGGGWLAFSGEDPLLPLEPPDDDRGPRDVVVLVDRSGSMSGEPFESVRRAVLRLVEAAPAEDALFVRFFGERLSDPLALKPAGDARERDTILREAAGRFLASGAPGGSTAIARSLEAFADSRERSGREALVFLLSDGKDTVDADAAARCARVLPRLLASRARLVVIAAGEAPDSELLSNLVAAGEALRAVGPLESASESLAEIFRREVEREKFREGDRLLVLPAPAAEGSLAADILGAEVRERSAAWPPIRRYRRARLVSGAEAIWVSERGEPLLAIHRVGQGLVAACAFEPDAAWSPLLAPLLRALARGRRGAAPRARIDSGELAGGELTIENLPEESPAELEARVFAAGAKAGEPPVVVLALSPPLEGADPLRTRIARVPALELGQGLARLEIRARGDVDATARLIVLPLPAPRSREDVLPRPRVDPGGLRAAARAPIRSGREPHPGAAWVLFSGLLLLTLSGLSGFFARRAG